MAREPPGASNASYAHPDGCTFRGAWRYRSRRRGGAAAIVSATAKNAWPRIRPLAAVECVDQVGRDAPGALRHFLDQVVAHEALQAALAARDDVPRLRTSLFHRGAS